MFFFTKVEFSGFLSETVKFNDSELSRCKIEDVWPYQSQNNHIIQLIKSIVARDVPDVGFSLFADANLAF